MVRSAHDAGKKTLPWWQALPAYQGLNLRWNPFGDASPAELAVMAIVEEDPLRLRPFEPLQIMAPAGHGKSTHLFTLQARVPDAVYEYVPFDQSQFRSRPGADQLFLLDEAQRVHRRHLRKLFARQRWLVLGTHHDLQADCPHPLRTFRIEPLSLTKLRAIVSARFRWAQADPNRPVPTIADAQLAQLLQSQGANLRAIIETLYEWIQHGKV
jgi:hypothetical protein